jgi:hypothetical protein
MLSLLLVLALDPVPVPLFDGKTLAGWEGDPATWRVEDGCIVGGTLDRVVPRNEFLATTKAFTDFELKVRFKLLGDPAKANAGVQFRTKRIPNHHEVVGYQADIGQGYWGAIYDESRRKRVLAGPTPEVMKQVANPGEWNDYVIRAVGDRITLRLNGTVTAEFTETDPAVERGGVIALQVHGGARAKVLYTDITVAEGK